MLTIKDETEAPEAPALEIADERSVDSVLIDAQAARMKAQKTHYALGDQSPGQEILQSQFQTGQETLVRESARALEGMRDFGVRRDMVQQITQGAAEAGRPLTYEEEIMLEGLTVEKLIDPKTVIENLYARRLTNQIATETPLDRDPEFPQAVAEEGDRAYQRLDAFETGVAQQEVANDIFRKVKAKYDATSWGRWGWDFFKSALPGYEAVQMHDISHDTGWSEIFPGTNMLTQIEGLYLLPPDRFREEAEKIVTHLEGFNVVLAMEFASHLLGYSAKQAFWRNALGVAEAIDIGTLAAPLAKSAATRLAARLAAAGRANARPNVSSSDIRAAIGDVEGAARDRAYVFIQEGQTRPGASFMEQAPASMNDNVRLLGMSASDPQAASRSVGTVASERARRLSEALREVQDNLRKIATDAPVIPRVSEPAAIDAAFRQAEANFLKNYPRVEDAIVDIRYMRKAPEQYGAVDEVHFMIGRTDATPFDNVEQAQYHANRFWLKEGSYDIVEEDGSVFIRMTKVVDETDPTVMKLRVDNDAPPDESMVSMIASLRSPDDILSPNHRMYRHLATYGGTEVVRFARQALEPIAKLSKRQNERLKEILHANHFEMRPYLQPDGSTKMLPGNKYDTLAQYEQAYYARYRELPTQEEVNGYFTAQKLNSWDLWMRRTQRMQSKARQGGEQKSIRIVSVSPDGRKSRSYTPYFEARTAKTLPWDAQESWTVAFHDGTKVRTVLHSSGKPMFKNDRLKIERLLEEGYEVLQPFDSAQTFLRQWAGHRSTPINYVLSKTTRTKPLDLVSQIEARYGGHGAVPDGVYIKQPIIQRDRFGRRLHTEDRTMMYFETNAQAKTHFENLEKARKMLIELDTNPNAYPSLAQTLYTHLSKTLPFKSVDHFRRYFRQNGGQYDLHSPFVMVRSGQSSRSLAPETRGYGDDVLSTLESAHNPTRGQNIKFMSEREGAPYTVENVGTEANPDFKFVHSPIVTPYETLLRSQGELLNSRMFNDYMLAESEKFVNRYLDLFAGAAEDVTSDPINAIRNPKWATSSHAGTARWQQAMAERQAILQLISAPSATKTALGHLKDRLLDSVYKRGGAKYVKAIEPWLWNEKSDPIGMIRGAAFTNFLGLFNPRHYFLNASVVASSAAITGNVERAVQANALAWMFRANRMADWHPSYGNQLGKMARDLFGMSDEEYKQMYEAVRRSGLMRMEGEHARYDHIFDRPLIRSKFEEAREASHFFFKEGDIYARMTAFNTAYLEWKTGTGAFATTRGGRGSAPVYSQTRSRRLPPRGSNQGPRGESVPAETGLDPKYTRDVEHAIVRRAADLAMNQTRASNNPLYQRGLASIPTQFITYQARIQDLVWGSRLTRSEKARFIAMQSILWGPWAAAGIAVGTVVPVYDWYREWIVGAGLDDEDLPAPARAVINGVVHEAMRSTFGREFDVSSFGPGGFDLVAGLLEGDASVLAGSSGKLIRDWIDGFDPVGALLTDMAAPPEDGQHPFKLYPEDFVRMFDEIPTARNAYRVWMAHQYGQLISKSGEYVTDLDTKEALFGLLTGLFPQEVTDRRIAETIMRDATEFKRETTKEALAYMNRAFRMWQSGDIAGGEAAAAQAQARLRVAFQDDPEGFDTALKQLWSQASNDPDYDKVMEQLIKRAPVDQRDTHFRRWERRIYPKLGDQ